MDSDQSTEKGNESNSQSEYQYEIPKYRKHYLLDNLKDSLAKTEKNRVVRDQAERIV